MQAISTFLSSTAGKVFTGVAVVGVVAVAIKALRNRKSGGGADLNSLRVTTYNVLANEYLKHSSNGIDEKLLEVEPRRQALVAKIKSFNSDVICLQEVERDLFETLKSGLEGYDGRFLKKKKGKPDGVAMFWKTSSIEVTKKARRFFRTDDRKAGEEGSFEPWVPAQMFKFKKGDNEFTVVNSHLRWNKDGSFAESQLKELDKHFDDNTIVCGDFNTRPNEAEEAGVKYLQGKGLKFASDKSTPGASTRVVSPPTSYVASDGGAKKIDYIFHGKGFTSKVDPLPSFKKLPNKDEPSDHLPLTATLTWAK